jgi:hypothetical protein
MLALGLLLILGAVALTVGAVYDGGDAATVEILGQTLSTTIAGVFFTGAATMLLFLMGVWLLTASMGRARRKRAERKEAKARQHDSVAQLEEERVALRAENERLAEELAKRRGATAGAAAGTGAAGAASGTAAGHDTEPMTAEPDTSRHPDTPAGGSDTRNDRVIDHHTDLTSRETTTSGRHRDA